MAWEKDFAVEDGNGFGHRPIFGRLGDKSKKGYLAVYIYNKYDQRMSTKKLKLTSGQIFLCFLIVTIIFPTIAIAISYLCKPILWLSTHLHLSEVLLRIQALFTISLMLIGSSFVCYKIWPRPKGE